MRRYSRRILRGQPVAPLTRKRLPQGHEFRRNERYCNATPQRSRAGGCQCEPTLPAAEAGQITTDPRRLLGGQRMEERQMRWDVVAMSGEMSPAQVLKPGKTLAVERERQDERGRDLAQN
jgi:hypothetical protein